LNHRFNSHRQIPILLVESIRLVLAFVTLLRIDGNELDEYVDFAKTYPGGHFPSQQQDPGSYVQIRQLNVMTLADGAVIRR
jgi:hypothetical protein